MKILSFDDNFTYINSLTNKQKVMIGIYSPFLDHAWDSNPTWDTFPAWLF